LQHHCRRCPAVDKAPMPERSLLMPIPEHGNTIMSVYMKN
jgi:hypothetical protein